MTEGGSRLAAQADKLPKVSIIAVVYNAAHMLAEFFENVLPYRSDEVELVILDGNSTDDTLRMLHEHNGRIDYWRSEPDQGIYDAMNKAVKYAKGQWLYFMGADDRLLAGFARMVGRLQQPNVIYYGKVIIWGEVIGRPLSKYDLTKIDICHQSIFYPAAVFEKYQYETTYRSFADQHLNIRCFTDKAFRWQFADELIAIYDTRGYSANNEDLAYQKDYPGMIRRYLGWKVYLRYMFKQYKQNRKQRNKK